MSFFPAPSWIPTLAPVALLAAALLTLAAYAAPTLAAIPAALAL